MKVNDINIRECVCVCVRLDEPSDYIHHRPKNRWIVFDLSLRDESLYDGVNVSKTYQKCIEIDLLIKRGDIGLILTLAGNVVNEV